MLGKKSALAPQKFRTAIAPSNAGERKAFFGILRDSPSWEFRVDILKKFQLFLKASLQLHVLRYFELAPLSAVDE